MNALEQIEEMLGTWLYIEDEPQDGSWISVRYLDGEEDIVRWAESRYFYPAKGAIVSYGPGYENQSGLPVDTPDFWMPQ